MLFLYAKTLLFFISFSVFASSLKEPLESINIITTDSSILRNIQETAQNVAIAKKLQVGISLVDESKIVRNLQLGKKGDILITSDINICNNLITKGLASPLDMHKVSEEHIYCTSLIGDGKVFIITPEEIPSVTQEKLSNIAYALNASVYVFNKNEDIHKKITEWKDLRIPICTIHSTFINLNIQNSEIKKTTGKIEYFACPLIGLKQDGYEILIKYYETQNNS